LLGNKLNKKDDDDITVDDIDAESIISKPQNKLGGDPKLKQLIYEMRVKNQVIYAFPNINMIMNVSH